MVEHPEETTDRWKRFDVSVWPKFGMAKDTSMKVEIRISRELNIGLEEAWEFPALFWTSTLVSYTKLKVTDERWTLKFALASTRTLNMNKFSFTNSHIRTSVSAVGKEQSVPVYMNRLSLPQSGKILREAVDPVPGAN